MRLDELTKFALALNSPSAVSPTKTMRSASSRFGSELAERLRHESNARDNAAELSAIRSVQELQIDHSAALSIKRGDLAIIQGEVFRCKPLAPHLQDIPLVLKRLDCVDRRTYDLKVYEADTFARFQGHANLVSLYSYWSEKPANPYVYKTLVLLFEEAILGDMQTFVVRNPKRPSNRLSLRYLCDIAKGLIAVHNCNFIHARVKPSAVYLSGQNTAMLGEFGKVELDSARQTHQLFSKLLIGEAIPKTLVYWAPELLKLDKYTKAADMWALGVTIYEIVTGRHPFNTSDENSFRDDALTGNVDMAPLEKYPRLAHIVRNLIRVNPEERWSANQVLSFAQYDFAVDVQRAWRGYVARKKFLRVRNAIILIQSHIRRFLARTRYWRMRAERQLSAAVNIQRIWRGFVAWRSFHRARRALMKCQANVLSKQGRRAYQKYRGDMVMCQAVIRAVLTRRWFARVRSQRRALEGMASQIQAMMLRYNEASHDFHDNFPERRVPPALTHLSSFEEFELSQPSGGPVCMPRLRNAHEEITRLAEDAATERRRVGELEATVAAGAVEDERMKKELGVKYVELTPMMEALKKNLKRVADACNRAMYLPIKIQHPYTYSKWDEMHEPHNVVENVLKDDDSVFRQLSPVVDLTLCNNQVCFVAEVVVCPGDVGPASMEIFTSNVPEKWTLISTHKCTRDAEQSFMLPGEQLCKFIRIKFANNIRGGNIVAVRMIKVRGLVREN